MKREMTSLDLKYIIREFDFLIGARIEKIYQDFAEKNNRNLRIKLYVKGMGSFELYSSSGRFHLTKQQREGKDNPTNFAMFLRKRLKNKRIVAIRQYEFERIVEIEFDDCTLVIELFHNGNFILIDKNHKIIGAFEYQKWSDRIIAPKNDYDYPSSDYFETDEMDFKRTALSSPRDVFSFIAKLGFGKNYTEDILKNIDIDPNEPIQMIGEDKIKEIFDRCLEMYEKESEPKIVIQDNQIIDAIPFDIEKYKDYKKIDIDSFNQAIDSYYGIEVQEEKKKEDKKDYLVKQHKQAIEKLEEKESKKRDVIEIINNNYDLIEDILNTIKKAKEQYTWSQIKEMVESEDTPEANAIEQIKEHEGLIVVNLSGKNFELNITKTPTENINDLYENAKHLKSKKEKTEENLEKIDTIVEKIEQSEPLVPKIKEKRKRKRWYENFRHFWTSDEYLVVAGKDADTNEQLVKKHTEPTDVVLHAEIQGAPFVIVKSRTDAREKEVKEISPVAIREASQFGAVYSKAWQKDLGNIDVYWVRPDQVKKVPGLPKGSFQIQGERSYLKKTSLKLSFGFDLETRELLVAPPQTISNKCRYYQTIQPGEVPAKELAEQIKETIIEKAINQEDKEKLEMIDENEIAKKIPSGKGRLL